MTLVEMPLWQEQAPMPANLGADPLPASTDVAIVGGGYTGLGAARKLKQLGMSAVVIDQHPIGWGASSRNGGKALVGLKHDASSVVRTYGREVGEALWRASLAGIDMVEAIARQEGIDCEFERTGSVYLACKPKHFDTMQRETAWLAKNFGYQRTDVGRADLHQEIATDIYFGGTVDPLSAGLHPAKWVRGLAEVAARDGVTLCGKTPVLHVDRVGARWLVRTSKGVMDAAEVASCLKCNAACSPSVATSSRLSRSIAPCSNQSRHAGGCFTIPTGS
jgi:glycine/D-amino acid oxidase-like deaminating enzyme